MDYDKILILDFGGQYGQLMARRIREFNVYSVIRSYKIGLEEIKKINPAAIIFSGDLESIKINQKENFDQKIFELGIPILGIGYGMQLMTQLLEGGKLIFEEDNLNKLESRKYTKDNVEILNNKNLFKKVKNNSQVWLRAGDYIEKIPAGFEITAAGKSSQIAGIADLKRNFYGVQFHPESNHTLEGKTIIHNFLFNIAEVKANWKLADYINEEVDRIRKQVGQGKVICGLSGGVDSAVAAAIVHKAVGDQLRCIFVDHGLLRKGEAEQVKRTFAEEFNIPLVFVDAKKRFLKRLDGVSEPEQKRKIIGEEFINVFDEEAEKLEEVKYLVQGTIYSDVIESGADDEEETIKSHHNVGGLPEEMNLELVEPLHFLFKDEVRKIGEVLGLPEEIVWRQPFPGPGLAIRIIGEVDWDKLEILREADAIIQQEIKEAGLYREIWQSFAVLPDLRSVGVSEDQRTYAYPIILRAVKSEDAMTANWARLPYELLESISSKVVNQVKDVNRVVYDITSKPPGTIEWE